MSLSATAYPSIVIRSRSAWQNELESPEAKLLALSASVGMSSPSNTHSEQYRRACLPCRQAKVRCQRSLPAQPCRRCTSRGESCLSTAVGHRGRLKGSKNRKTLERLRAGTSQESRERTARPIPTLISPKSAVHSAEFDLPVELGYDSRNVPGDEDPLSDRPNRLQNSLLLLAQCARNLGEHRVPFIPNLRIPRPSVPLPPPDAALLETWSLSDLRSVTKDQLCYFQHGMHASKPDIGDTLDPITCGIATLEDVQRFFDAYFRYINPQFGVLQASLHTLSYVRSRSAFLTTVVAFVGAVALASLPGCDESMISTIRRLEAHVEDLFLVILRTGAKSCEIVQGLLLNVWRPIRKSRHVDDQRLLRLGMCTRMAISIGLHRKTPDDSGKSLTTIRDELRTRISILLLEDREEKIANRGEPADYGLHLNSKEKAMLASDPEEPGNASLAAQYELLCFEQQMSHRLVSMVKDNKFDTVWSNERIYLSAFIDKWTERWWKYDSNPLFEWHLRYLAAYARILGLLRIAKAQAESGQAAWSTEDRQLMLALSRQTLRHALDFPWTLQILCSTYLLVLASIVIMQMTPTTSPDRALPLRVALRLIGDPRQTYPITFTRHNGMQIMNLLCMADRGIDVPPPQPPTTQTVAMDLPNPFELSPTSLDNTVWGGQHDESSIPEPEINHRYEGYGVIESDFMGELAQWTTLDSLFGTPLFPQPD